MNTKIQSIASKLVSEFGESTFKDCMSSIENGRLQKPGSNGFECEQRLNELLEDYLQKYTAITRLIEIANP